MASTEFDRVEVKDSDGTVKLLTKAAFLALPLNERISHILKGSLKFFNGRSPVPEKDALRELNC